MSINIVWFPKNVRQYATHVNLSLFLKSCISTFSSLSNITVGIKEVKSKAAYTVKFYAQFRPPGLLLTTRIPRTVCASFIFKLTNM